MGQASVKSKFWDLPTRTKEEWDDVELKPLVKRGESAQDRFNEVVTNWCASSPAAGHPGVEEHVNAGGFVLDGIDLVDANSNPPAPIDLADLLRSVEDQLRTDGESQEYRVLRTKHIILRNCRVRKCKASGVNIRPQFAAIGCRVDDCDFDDTTFGEVRFDSTRFGSDTSFQASRFLGLDARFDSATFERSVHFDEALFRRGARFQFAAFDSVATFSAARFGLGTTFDYAVFGSAAVFTSARFEARASFRAASFRGLADFESTIFGDYACFDSSTFTRNADFLNARFGPGGGVSGLVVGSVHHSKHGFESARGRLDRALFGWVRASADRPRRWLAVHVSWNTIRAAGESAILSRVSIFALVLVPIVAGCWPAVRAIVHGYALGLGESKGAYESARAGLLLEAAKIPASQLDVTRIVERLDTQVTAIAAQMHDLAVSDVALPVSWSLLFFGALAVTLARTVYGWGAPPEVRERSRDAAMAADASEFREKKDQKRDLLLRAITRLQRSAEVLPEVRHPSFVKRHGAAVWVPKSMEEFDAFEQTYHADVRAREEAKGDEEKTKKLRPPLANTPEAMEIILIEEGAAAEYDLKSHEAPVRMNIAGFLYAAGAYCIAWLIVHQSTTILKQTRGGDYWPDYWATAAWILAGAWFAIRGLVMLPWLWRRANEWWKRR